MARNLRYITFQEVNQFCIYISLQKVTPEQAAENRK